MNHVKEDSLNAHRARTFRLSPGVQLRKLDEALEFVEARGFVTLWPIQGIDLPNLWTATAGDRPVASEHDDPGHVTWGWKDEMLDKRQWYYGKLLRGKATVVSLDVIPYFYAMSERVAELDDYRLAYEDGLLTHEAFRIAEALFRHGAQHTIRLRRLSHLNSAQSKSRFNKALTDLQRGLWILPVGVARAGAWRYAFIYELFDRWLTDVAAQARRISLAKARAQIAHLYLKSVGASTPKDVGRLFHWRATDTANVLRRLTEEGAIVACDDGRVAISEVTH